LLGSICKEGAELADTGADSIPKLIVGDVCEDFLRLAQWQHGLAHRAAAMKASFAEPQHPRVMEACSANSPEFVRDKLAWLMWRSSIAEVMNTHMW
jgi:hypothetical protein